MHITFRHVIVIFAILITGKKILRFNVVEFRKHNDFIFDKAKSETCFHRPHIPKQSKFALCIYAMAVIWIKLVKWLGSLDCAISVH